MGLTQDQIQAQIHYLYEGDEDVPTTGDEDYTIRTGMCDAAINRWENEYGMLWNELWVKLTDAADGDKVTADGTLSYDCPSDFVFPGGYVRLYTTAGQSSFYAVIPPGDSQLLDNVDRNVCYFTGNPQDGYSLNFLDDPDAVYTISYEYYKQADTLAAVGTIPEMSDPYYIVYYVLSRLYELDNRAGLASKSFQEAEQRLSQMRARNMQNPFHQYSRFEDEATLQGIGGFGV